MDESADLETVVSLLHDEYARGILTATSERAMTVSELSNQMDASEPTLYRRTERLSNADLLAEQTRVRSDGHHDTVYVTTLRAAHLTLEDGAFELSVERTEDAADRLRRLWRDL